MQATTTNPLTQRQEEFVARVQAARHGSLADYAYAVHNLVLEPYQELWEQILDEEERGGIVCPPDTYKSTTVRLWVERAIGRNPNLRVLWLMNAGDQASRNVMTIKQTITMNRVFRAAFPRVKPDNEAQWTNSVLFVERDYSSPDPTLLGTGINGAYQGLHFDIIIIDDPTNQEDLRSPTEMEAQRQKLRGVIIDRLIDNGRIFFILTRWGAEDLVPTFVDMAFNVFVMPIISEYPWGHTLSPRRFTDEWIENKRRDKGDALFQLTYMCDTQSVVGGFLKRDDIGYWDNSMIPQSLSVYMGVDPAASEKQMADYASIATVGVDYSRRVNGHYQEYLLNVWAGKVGVGQLRKEIAKQATQTSNLLRIGMETIGFQVGLMQDMRRIYRINNMMEIPYRNKTNVQKKIIGVDKNKYARMMWLANKVQQKRLLLPKYLKAVDGVSLETELCSHPFAAHDDRSDSIAFASILCESAMGTSQIDNFKAKVSIN